MTDALERALASLDVRTGSTRRHTLSAGGDIVLPTGAATLVYLVSGEITGDLSGGAGCEVDAPTGDGRRVRGRRTLLAGDAVMSLGCRALVLSSQSGAEVVVVTAEITPSEVVASLPGTVLVTGFAGLEPAAAALAGNLGPHPGALSCERPGDSVVCRSMIRSVLLSAVRAWASSGTWPAPIADRFLARVAAAVEADPGRDWTIDHLASLAAMSRTVFAERFREAMGSSPAGYVTEVRVREAQRRLEAGASVSEVSRALGYASDEGFRRAFRRRTGVAPSAWRAHAVTA
ncbi:helix-turn-helix domain-containing protein [Microbacterium sp. RURRCA19A]|uniref:helix-turn-helix domain-containing protein n=1 Tax=Microbacterium sp. RURRCA19A TaxID=1907391 RepID=UPI000956DD05|nr:AraC family transcriptional regulator [Microbacterium sp. RURRCA19A]SIR92359.1 AraC-type DNA-binding protein [Microbacterium sp. RURRCA19A]